NRQKDNRINLTELLDSRSNASFIFNSCIGAAMLFEYRSESIEAILANDDYFDLIDPERMLFKKLRHNLLDNLDAERRAMAIASVEEAIANKTHSCDIKVDSCGKNIRVSMRHVNSADEGHIIFAVFEDITETLQIKEELTQQWVQTKYKTLTRIPGTITYDYDPENDVLTIDVCETAGNIKTVSAERFLNGGECSWLDDESMEKHRQVFREALKSPTSGSMDFRVKFASNDDYIWYRSYYTSVTDYSGKVYRIVGRSDSIEKDMRIAADWKKRACHDALTGMLNHDATIEVLKKRIIESGGGALVLVDIDNFRCINESLGHVKGNNILKNIADTIKKVFRKEDMLGRFGGDEFVIFLQGVLNRENVEIRVKSLVYALQDIYIENDLKVCASIGVAIDTSGKVSAYELLEYAESAMLHAKKEADERYYFYGNSSAIPNIAGESCLHE
ncbi:MAG: sensor domain-containing diguanylate cyclase, partial [Lachnospiraceae bacterium]